MVDSRRSIDSRLQSTTGHEPRATDHGPRATSNGPRATDILSLGECMAEFTRAKNSTWEMSFAGDAYNTIVYASRLGMRSGFLSCVGDDALSADMKAAWENEKIDVKHVKTLKGGRTGLYLVSTDKQGERSFDYFRRGSAASQTLANISADKIVAAALKSNVFYFTGVTMAVMQGHDQLRAVLEQISGKTVIAFDMNYRAPLWSSRKEFRDALKIITPFVSLLFMSDDDLQSIGTTVSLPRALEHYTKHGTTCIVKCGAEGAKYFDDGRLQHALIKPVKPVDTTGAGDAFNAGVLSGLLLGNSLRDAVALGNSVASVVVRYRGAIVDRKVWNALV